MLKSSCLFLTLSLLIAFPLFGQQELALKYYDEKNYTAALNEWKKLVNGGAKGEEVYYNLANTYYRLNRYPEAILNYNKALRWNPHCKECKLNLELCNKQAGIETFELPEFFLTRIYHTVLFAFQPIGWYGLSIALISLVIGLLFLMPERIARWKFWVYCLLLLSVAGFFMAWQRDRIRYKNDEVILMNASPLYLSPDPASEFKQQLIPGQSLIILDQISGWYKVHTREFDQGWVEEKNTALIKL